MARPNGTSTSTSRARAGLSAFYLHLHPKSVRQRSTRFATTFGLGFATIVSLVVAGLSGAALMFHYIPCTDHAHGSLQDIISVVPLGAFMRNLHRWSAHASVALCGLHLLRTYYWGCYRATHRRVWLVGVGLFVLTLATSFTGYLLPWDQDAYWTVTVGTSVVGYVPLIGQSLKMMLLGADVPNAATLVRFYAFHVIVLPGLGLLLVVIHLFRLRRAGGLARPVDDSKTGGANMVATYPKLIERQVVLALLICLALVLASLLVSARLGPAPDLMRPDNPPKAPWFLVGLQEMVSISALWGGVVVPLLFLGLLAAVPWLDGGIGNDARLVPGRRQRGVAAAALALPPVAIVVSVCPFAPPWFNPLVAVAVVVASLLLLVGILWRDRHLLQLVVVSALIAALVTFTLIGWYWRGPDWRLQFHPGPGRPAAHAIGPQKAGAAGRVDGKGGH